MTYQRRDKFYLDFMFVEPCLGKRANKDEMHAPIILEAGYLREGEFRKKTKQNKTKEQQQNRKDDGGSNKLKGGGDP